jgi:hypothetical protein
MAVCSALSDLAEAKFQGGTSTVQDQHAHIWLSIDVGLDICPLPIADLRHIIAVLSNVFFVIDEPGAHRLFGIHRLTT